MTAFLELIQMAVFSVAAVFASPFFWLVVYLVYVQYRRNHEMEIMVLGEARKTLGEKVRNAIITGILGGLAGTIIIMLLGITIEIKDFSYIFPLALLLMLINMRYICFSYAGGLLALSSLILGIPKLNVSSIMAIVAILHLVECILIYFDGYRDAVPVFLNDSRFGIVGGFMLQRFWPIPFAVLLAVAGPLEGAKEINLPDWWPIFKENIDINSISLQISAVVAALGYGDTAVVNTPKMKSRKSAVRLFTYSIVLLALAVLSTGITAFKYIAALFSPIGHELLILYGQREEKSGIPQFRQRSHGVTVLDIMNGSIGEKIKLKQGDVILSVNNHDVNDREDIQQILHQFPTYIWIEIQDIKGKKRTIEYQDYRNGIGSLGIVLVPRESDIVFDTKNSVSLLKKLLQKLLRR